MLWNGNVVYIKEIALNIHLMLLFLHITQGQEYRSVIHRNFFTFNVKHCSCLHQVLNDDEQKSIFYLLYTETCYVWTSQFYSKQIRILLLRSLCTKAYTSWSKLFESYDPTQIDFRFKDMHITYFEIQHTIYATEFEDTNICPHILSP